ncbi:MAG: Gfo/Idh/MocA family oxidoreductase [Terrimicrobiaceae bacterium]
MSGKVGIVGCGNICEIYLKNSRLLADVEVLAVSDIDIKRAQSRAGQFEIPKALSVPELLAEEEIEIVLNLTIPKAHAEVGLAALEAGKSVYNEKPLAIRRKDARKMLDMARAKGLRVGCAPDTFLGAGAQTCRQLIDTGAIGTPIGATAFMTCRGHESWHPDPGFYYQPGGGPMFDMGPYYLTTLVALLGQALRVTGSARISFPERTITSEPKFGTKIPVEVPTHIAAVIDFACGAVASVIMSFDVWDANLPRIEIYGSEGSLSVPDPNVFGGPVNLWRHDAREWREVPLASEFVDNWRGLGLADMALALRDGRPHRANGALAYHVLDIMHAIHDASRDGRHVELTSKCDRPEQLPAGRITVRQAAGR